MEVAKCIVEAGFPPGVINIIQGAGKTGQFMCEHMKIRKLAFTGSTATGRRVQAAAAMSNLKVVSEYRDNDGTLSNQVLTGLLF